MDLRADVKEGAQKTRGEVREIPQRGRDVRISWVSSRAGEIVRVIDASEEDVSIVMAPREAAIATTGETPLTLVVSRKESSVRR